MSAPNRSLAHQTLGSPQFVEEGFMWFPFIQKPENINSCLCEMAPGLVSERQSIFMIESTLRFSGLYGNWLVRFARGKSAGIKMYPYQH